MGDIEKFNEYVKKQQTELSEGFLALYAKLNYFDKETYTDVKNSEAFIDYMNATKEMSDMLSDMVDGKNTKDIVKVENRFSKANERLVQAVYNKCSSDSKEVNQDYFHYSIEELNAEIYRLNGLDDIPGLNNDDIKNSDLSKEIGAKDNNLANLTLDVFDCVDKTGINLEFDNLFKVSDAKVGIDTFSEKASDEIRNQKKAIKDSTKAMLDVLKTCNKEACQAVKNSGELEKELAEKMKEAEAQRKNKGKVDDNLTEEIKNIKGILKGNDAALKAIIDIQSEENKQKLNSYRNEIIQRKVIVDVLSKDNVADCFDKLINDALSGRNAQYEKNNRDKANLKNILKMKRFYEDIAGEAAYNLDEKFNNLQKTKEAYLYLKRVDEATHSDAKEFLHVYDNAKANVKLTEADTADNCKHAEFANLDKALVMINRFKGKSYSDEYKEVIKAVARLKYESDREDAKPELICGTYKRVNEAIDKYLKYATDGIAEDGTVKVKKVGMLSNQSSRDSKVNILTNLKTYLNERFIDACAAGKEINLAEELNTYNAAKDKIKSITNPVMNM